MLQLMKVCIGGTFDILHKGHKLLIDKAFEVAGDKGYIFIGLATGEIVKTKREVEPFEQREKNVINYLSEKKSSTMVEIKPITDKYGPTLDEEFDAIIVSPETLETAEEINRKRIKTGKKPLKVIEIPFVLAEDGIPISSSRIKKGEINAEGEVLK